jgi:hypothetical protein
MAVKNVTFEVTANTQNAQASLSALIAQLDQIKKNSTISFTQSTGNIDAQIKSLTTKLDKLASDNQKRIDSETKSVTDNQKTQTNAVKSAIDEQKRAYENFAKYNADVLKKEQKAFQEAQAAKIKAARDTKKAEREQIVQQAATDKTSNKKQVASTAYAQVSESVKQLNARSRELGAQLIQLDQAGQKNSVTYKSLAKEYATVKAEADKASAALKQLNSNSNLQPSVQKLGGLSGAINFISRSVANSSANFVRLQNVIARTGVALGAVSIGAAVLSFGRAAINAAKNYETLSVSFGTLIGNAVLAQQKIKELRTFAAETPFTVDDVFQASRTLLGYGVTVGELIPTIKTLGDVAGGVGVPLERLALVFGQVRAAGRLYGQDLLQLVTAGFNPLAEISRTTGESFDSLKDKMRKGLITFDDVQNAFKTATSEGGKFFNLTNALANTTTGRLARLSEEYNELLKQIGEGLLPAFNGLINFGRASLEFFRELPKTIKENSTVFTLLTAATTALTASYFANSLNVVSNTVKIGANTVVKIANRVATAAQAAQNVVATQGISAQTVAQAGLTFATRIGTSAINAFKAAWASNPLGLIVTALTTAAAAWYSFSDAVDTTTDNFINADEAFNEFQVNSQKAIDSETAATKKLFDTAKDGNKSFSERQKAVDEINKKYQTSIKLTGDQEKDVKLIERAWLDVEQAIVAVNQEAASTAIIAKLNDQIADVQLQLLNLGSEAGIKIPIELITSDEEKSGGFEKTKALIQGRLDELSKLKPSNLVIGEAIAFGGFGPASTAGLLSFNEAINSQINAVEPLNLQLEKLIESYGTLGAFAQQALPKGSNIATPTIDEDAAKKAARRLKEFEEQYISFLDRIRKNNEDIKKQNIEFEFVNAADFEEEIIKLQQLDRVNQDTVDREIDREIESVRQREITEQQKNTLISQLEIIRGQEQEKRANDLEKRLYEIERDGLVARRKLANELGDLYAGLTIQRLDTEIESLDRLRDEIDNFYLDIFEDNPFAKGRFITAPRIEFGGTEFQFEDAQADLEELKKTINDLNALNITGGLADDDLQETKLSAINEFNEKYKTTIKLTANETDQVEELSKAYDDLKKSAQASFTERRKQNIFQFSRGVQERGQEDPFVRAIEDSQREYFSLLSEQEKQEVKRREDKRNAEIALLDENYALNLKAVNDEKKLKKDALDVELLLIKASSTSQAEKDKKTRLANIQYQIEIGNIEKGYADLNKEIEKNIAVESDKGLKIKKINIESETEIEGVRKTFAQRRAERAKKDTDSIEENNEAQLAVIKEERDARIQALEDITQAFLDFQKVFIDGQIQQTEAAINAQQKRVDAAKEIADKGNVILLKAEEERLDKLNRQRANYVRQQQNLAAVEIAVNSAIAVAKAAGQPGAPFTIVAILAAMAVGFAQARAQANAAATFAKGGYTGDGHQFQEAGTVHKGEFVMNAQKTRQYRPLLEAIHSGRHPELGKSVNDKVFVVNSKSSDERLERIERAIREQQGMQLSIDENGINGIVSRISYKQKRINNRAR